MRSLAVLPVLTPSAWASLADVTLSATTVVGTSAADGALMRELDVDVAWSTSIGMLEAVYLSGRLELDSLVARSVRRAADDPVLLHGGLAAGFEI